MPQQVTTGPAPMEGVERTNAVVVRGAEQGAGIPPRRDSFMMEVDRGETVMPVGDLGTWPIIAGTGDKEAGWQIIGEWNMEVVELRRYQTLRTI